MGLASFFHRCVFRSDFHGVSLQAVFFGLGNPGKEYERTRHNIGFRAIDAIAEDIDGLRRIPFTAAAVYRGTMEPGLPVAAVKPLSSMNRSGAAVAAVLGKWNVQPGQCLIIVDDINLPLGRVRARRGGSDGGHNGLKSVIDTVGPDFPRLRIGIGPLPQRRDIIDHVLGTFSEAEERVLSGVLSRTREVVKLFAAKGIDAAMNAYN